jgi:hypothetical protein
VIDRGDGPSRAYKGATTGEFAANVDSHLPCVRCGRPQDHYCHHPRVNDTVLPMSTDTGEFYHLYVAGPRGRY